MAIEKEIHVKNNDFQHIEVLKQNRYKRHRYGKFFVEGVRNINAALSCGWSIDAWIYSEHKPLSDWAKDVLKRGKAALHYKMALPLMEALSDKEETSELLAVVKMKEQSLEKIPLKSDLLVAIFDRPSSPGNLGTVIRSCDALKVDALLVTGHAADLYDPATIKASVGAMFSLPVVLLESSEKVKPLLERLEGGAIPYQIVGTSAKADGWVDDHDFRKATLVVIGNETSGMSAAYKDLCHRTVSIPISGTATSLNVGCAASIVLYEIDRQRRKDK